mmetsp:Transcript_26318/g.83606  ORF Transcript_26318/g.83606 Transcript_26318/m.83606 type:complete len:90 (-) Transcript_26318:14-283(-)
MAITWCLRRCGTARSVASAMVREVDMACHHCSSTCPFVHHRQHRFPGLNDIIHPLRAKTQPQNKTHQCSINVAEILATKYKEDQVLKLR